jgi:Ino eighty subunit 2
MPPGRSLRSRASLTASSTPYPQTMSRTRRTASSNTNSSPAITVARVPSPETNKKSIRLTVKMPSNKLREATSGGVRESITVNSRDTFDPSLIVSGPRGTRAKRTVVIESGSEDDEDEEEEAEDEDVEEDEEDDDGADEDEAGSDEDAEGEDDDADADGTSEEIEVDAGGDTPMEDAAPPPPSIIRMRGPASKPSVTVTPATDGKVKSVEAKGMQPNNSDDDEDLSELESAAEGDEGEEDAEGEEIGDEDQDMDQDDEDADSDADTPAAGSRASTPDVSKMTKRQRSRLDQVMGSDFLQLPMGTSPVILPSLPPPLH